MKKILVLGAGLPQVDLIKACKEKGWEVHCCSFRAGDPGEAYVDQFAEINIIDVNAIYEYVMINDIDVVYSVGSDIAMPTAFTISEKKGEKPLCSSQAATICNSKFLLRKTLGLNTYGNIPCQILLKKEDKIEVEYPLMMKPVDSQGQRGVVRVNNRSEVEKNFESSMIHSRCKALILEQFVEGREISVNTFSEDGKLIFFLPSKRVVWEEFTGGLIHKHIIDNDCFEKEDTVDKVKKLVKNTLEKLGIENGPAYFQIVLDKDENPYLIEVTPRLDGCHMWRLIKYSTGIDLLSLTIEQLDGKKIAKVPEYKIQPYETEFLCQPPETTFDKNNFSIGEVEYLEWYYKDGELVHRMNGHMEKCGYVIRKLV